MKVALYLRVSTNQQTCENQRLELEKHCDRMDWKIVKVYMDEGLSGKNVKRPALQQMLNDAGKGRFDALVDGRLIGWQGRCLTSLASSTL